MELMDIPLKFMSMQEQIIQKEIHYYQKIIWHNSIRNTKKVSKTKLMIQIKRI